LISACPTAAAGWLLADWLELEALSSAGDSASVHAVNANAPMEEDAESEEFDEDGVAQEDRIARLTTEIRVRKEVLGATYPFRLSESGTQLEWVPAPNVGSVVYLFCLLASHLRSGGFLSQEASLDIALKKVPELFQACATWCAAGYEVGPSYSVGWPRLDKSGFLQKLGEVYGHLGDGVPHAEIPNGAPEAVKDDGIDVIAWRTMPDARAPATYLLAQVASGNNWREKSVITAIRVFHATWFRQTPQREGRPALMIPFCIDTDADDDDDPGQEELAMRWKRLLAGFGEVFYRYRVPVFAERGFTLHSGGTRPIELIEWRPRVEDFVLGTIIGIRALEAA
jgi:hypothetical protein